MGMHAGEGSGAGTTEESSVHPRDATSANSYSRIEIQISYVLRAQRRAFTGVVQTFTQIRSLSILLQMSRGVTCTFSPVSKRFGHKI